VSWFTTTTGARIGQLLNALDFNEAGMRQGGWTTAGARNTSLDTGDTIQVPNADGQGSMLSLIQSMLEAERGVFYISKDGKATYEERESRARRTTSTATITTGALRSDPGFEFDNLINRQTCTATSFAAGTQAFTPNTANNGVPQVGQNPTSVRAYGVQDGSDITNGYIPSDTAALNLAQYIVNLRSSFAAPVKVELDSGSTTTLLQQLSLELQDRVTVTDANAGTSGDYIVEGIEVEITNGGNSFVTTYTLSDYGVLPFAFAGAGATAATAPQAVFAPPDGTVTFTSCTYAGRPTSPTNGDYIYETDTGRYYKRVAGAWSLQTYPRLTY
jgi:hypothetical protein